MAETPTPRRFPFKAKDVGAQVEPGAKVRMNLRNEAGDEIFVELEEGVARLIGFELVLVDAQAHATTDNPQPDVPFDTESALAMLMGGNGAGGHILLRFLTPAKVWLSTMVGPSLAATLANNLNSALALMPKPPAHWGALSPFNAPLAGKSTSTNAVIYFGQKYPRDIVEMLGVLMIRANLLETALVALLAHVSGLSMKNAATAFFSSQNNKARLDLIRNLNAVSELSDGDKKWVESCLDRAKKVADQRNVLVHGEWEFKKDKFSVKERAAVPKEKKQSTISSYKSLNDLASKYHDLSGEIHSILASKAFMARNTSETK